MVVKKFLAYLNVGFSIIYSGFNNIIAIIGAILKKCFVLFGRCLL